MLTSISLGDRYIARDGYILLLRCSLNIRFPKISSKSFRVIIPIQIIFPLFHPFFLFLSNILTRQLIKILFEKDENSNFQSL